MTRRRYRAARADGRIVRGVLAAPTDASADALLTSQGLSPLTYERVEGPSPGQAGSRRDLAVLFRSLATLVAAGIPLERALAVSESLPRGSELRDAIRETRSLLCEGQGLAEALRQSGAIPGAVVGMLRAGERGSQLPNALEQAARQLEQEADLATRIRQALAYPLILLFAGSVSVGIIATVVVPRFAVILADAGQALPPATRALISVAGMVRSSGGYLLLAAFLAAALATGWYRTPAGRLHLHRSLLAMPGLGPMRHGFASARAARVLGALLSTGVPALAALEAAAEAAADSEVADRLGRTRNRVAEGAAMGPALGQEAALTPSALQLLMVGDSSGQLGAMALRAGDLAALEAESRLQVVVSSLEPVLVVVFGGLVAFVAAALLQAVYSLRPGA